MKRDPSVTQTFHIVKRLLPIEDLDDVTKMSILSASSRGESDDSFSDESRYEDDLYDMFRKSGDGSVDGSFIGSTIKGRRLSLNLTEESDYEKRLWASSRSLSEESVLDSPRSRGGCPKEATRKANRKSTWKRLNPHY